ncbi:MAG TPA: undecaprenyl/decaprenyl-phosphate alpha-N-acetylglucosaminyl 1-phosphate transferase [Acidimicrobiales bacterium]|nr:undecaprenyl/decaprenyl-phosphate alpha-N-acetylglucosaminyl 1-phosphate transferase [Acidimicrobiales bacterium]
MSYIHFRDYLVVFAVAVVVTYVATFGVRYMARRHALVVMPDAERVHERPTATVGGTAMYLGMLAAVAVASQIPAFSVVFKGNSAPMGVVLAATVMFGVGFLDDVRDMSPPAKLAGQILAAMVLYFFGVSMLFFHVPLAETTLWLRPDQSVLATVLWVTLMANSVNFIDGLDGLAAGIVAIAAAAFFVYSHQLSVVGNITVSNAGPLIAIVALGICVGFLPHNFHPAKIFMGDTGALLLGLLLAASTLAVVGQDSFEFSGRTYFFFAPVLIPFFILGIPMLDTAFAIVRRAGKRMSPAVRDVNHMHHRLMRLGHGHRPAVLILWAWTALLSGLVLWPGVTNSHNEIPPIAVGALAIALYTLFAPRGRDKADRSDRAAALAGAPGTNGATVTAAVTTAGGTALAPSGDAAGGATGLPPATGLEPTGRQVPAPLPTEPAATEPVATEPVATEPVATGGLGAGSAPGAPKNTGPAELQRYGRVSYPGQRASGRSAPRRGSGGPGAPTRRP